MRLHALPHQTPIAGLQRHRGTIYIGVCHRWRVQELCCCLPDAGCCTAQQGLDSAHGRVHHWACCSPSCLLPAEVVIETTVVLA